MRRARNDADEEAEQRAAPDRPDRLPPFLPVRQEVAQPRRDHLADDLVARRREDLAEPEQADRDRHDADAVAQLGEVEAVAEMAGHVVDADHPEQEPDAAISSVRTSEEDDI